MSWIHIKGKTFKFVTNDNSIPSIYPALKQLYLQLQTEGYIPDTTWVLHDVDEKQKEDLLCGHR